MIHNILELLLDPKDKEQIVIAILEDFIIFRRIADPLWQITNALQKGDNMDFEPENKFNGYITALKVMGIYHDDSVCSDLSDILHNAIEANPQQEYDVLAKNVFASWMQYLKNYSLSHLKPVA